MNYLVRRLVSHNVGNKVITIVVFHPVSMPANLANFRLLDMGLLDSHFHSNSTLNNFSRAMLTIINSLVSKAYSSLRCSYLRGNPCKLPPVTRVLRVRRTTSEMGPPGLLTSVMGNGMPAKGIDRDGRIKATGHLTAKHKVPTSPTKKMSYKI